MSPVDHFLSRLNSLENSLKAGVGGAGRSAEQFSADWLSSEFFRLTVPVIGTTAAEDIYYRTLERICRLPPEGVMKLGYMAAFFLGEYDESSMSLEEEDWREIQQTVEDASEVININTLTGLMNSLLSRGLLK
jgi:hypothetical protein